MRPDTVLLYTSVPALGELEKFIAIVWVLFVSQDI
jgi:hypothetical protein